MPAGPFYHAVPREDRLPIPPMSSDGGGLDEIPAARAEIGSPTLAPGDHVGPLRHLRGLPMDVTPGYPLRLYELSGVVGLRHEGNGDYRYLVADDAAVAQEVPAWRYFGRFGEDVPDILEGIWTLDQARVSRLVVPPGERPFERIPVPLLPVPANELGARNAAGATMTWTETKSWAAGHGGGFYYRGCYFTYIVSDPQWLMAMGLAYNAAVATALGPGLAPDVRRIALAAWADLTDG
jgi:hypothetical protein